MIQERRKERRERRPYMDQVPEARMLMEYFDDSEFDWFACA